MSIQVLQDELAAWQNPTVATSRVQERIDALEGEIYNSEVSVELRVACVQALAELQADARTFINRHIAALQDGIEKYDSVINKDAAIGVD